MNIIKKRPIPAGHNRRNLTVLFSGAIHKLLLLPVAVLFSACNAFNSDPLKSPQDGSNTVIELPAPTPLPAAEAGRLHDIAEAWFDSALRSTGFNGGMIVAKKGNVVFEAYNGSEKLDGSKAITGSTPMHIASVSKTFTAMAVLKLWQDGKLSLDEPFSKYFPAFVYPGITIRNLLNHRSGLPNYLYFMAAHGWSDTSFVSNQDVMQFLIDKKDVLENISTPGTHFNYCNTNYALLALLIEKASGMKYAEYLERQFFQPLQMKHTYVFRLADSAHACPSFDWRGRIIPFMYLDGVIGDKNIYTTPGDLLKWDRALTSGKLFTEKTLQEAYTPYSNEKAGIRNYGLGWRMNAYPDGKKIIYHNGWWHGSNAAFIRLIQDSATIIVIGNRYNRAVYHAKDLDNAFGSYAGGEEDEENDNRQPDHPGVSTNDAPASVPASVTPVKNQPHPAKKGRAVTHKRKRH